jgi:hypothetical protein
MRVDILEEDTAERLNRESIRQAADVLAKILDTAVQIPGTRIRVGLDPLLGLIPGIGDALASLIGSSILLMASQLQVPKIVMVRMSVNILINGVVGAIPLFGDLFSVWFRSNARNAALLRRHSSSIRKSSTSSDWAIVIGITVGTLALTIGAIIGALTASLWLIARLWELVQ